jgi:hypothetical protein
MSITIRSSLSICARRSSWSRIISEEFILFRHIYGIADAATLAREHIDSVRDMGIDYDEDSIIDYNITKYKLHVLSLTGAASFTSTPHDLAARHDNISRSRQRPRHRPRYAPAGFEQFDVDVALCTLARHIEVAAFRSSRRSRLEIGRLLPPSNRIYLIAARWRIGAAMVDSERRRPRPHGRIYCRDRSSVMTGKFHGKQRTATSIVFHSPTPLHRLMRDEADCERQRSRIVY